MPLLSLRLLLLLPALLPVLQTVRATVGSLVFCSALLSVCISDYATSALVVCSADLACSASVVLVCSTAYCCHVSCARDSAFSLVVGVYHHAAAHGCHIVWVEFSLWCGGRLVRADVVVLGLQSSDHHALAKSNLAGQ